MRQSGSLATRQDIYNRIADVRRDACEGQNPIHALANQPDKESFWSRIQFAPDGRVTAVLFAYADSLAYLRVYPELLLLDCTYKTNKYGMPLLDMTGIAATQRSFCIAFAFLSSETEHSQDDRHHTPSGAIGQSTSICQARSRFLPRPPRFRKARWFTRGWTLQELIAQGYFSNLGSLQPIGQSTVTGGCTSPTASPCPGRLAETPTMVIRAYHTISLPRSRASARSFSVG